MKAKAIWIIPALILIGLLLAFIFWPQPKPLSPLASYTPQLEGKLRTKIITPISLDFSSAKTLKVSSPRYLVFNLDTAKVYLASNSAQKIAPASFTKLLTAQVALDLGFPDQLLTATKTSVDKVPTILGLKVGEQLTLSDLLRASIATSANDAASTLAEAMASQNGLNLVDYVELMNKKASLLSMTNSHFSNPDGLDDPTQYSTLEDLAKVVENVVKNYPEIVAAGASDRLDINISPTHGFYYLPNWNGLLGVYPGVTGLKIAYTENAGYSTIILLNKGNLHLALLLSGADKLLNRDKDAGILLDEALKEEKISPATITESQLKAHYKIWNDLSAKIRKELGLTK